jgi:cytochrome c-type biogenesis protein CcmF
MLFPNIAQVLGGTKVYLGADFYNRVFAPLALVIVLLMGICPQLGWRQSALPRLRQRLQYPAILAIALMILLFVLRMRQPLALLALGLIAFAASTPASEWTRLVVARSRLRAESVWSAAASLYRHNRRQYGGKLVHLSILLIAIGIVGSSLYKAETVVALAQGESGTVRGYTLRYEGSQVVDEPARRRFVATVGVYSGPTRIGTLKPEKNLHWNIEQYVTEVALRSTPVEDLYVALDWPEQDGVATFRIGVYPLVIWLWIGAGLLLLGTLIALWPTTSEPREMSSDTDSA